MPEHVVHQTEPASRRAIIRIDDADIERLIEVTATRSRCPNRDVALILTLFGTGAKPLEIAQLQIADYLHADGSVRRESTMRAEAAVNGEARPLYFDSARMIAALDAYLSERVAHGVTVHPEATAYRRLDPHSRLFLTEEGAAMPVVMKAGRRRQCNAMLELLRTIFERAGMRGAVATSARRTLVNKLIRRNCSQQDIGVLLGISKDSVRDLVANSPCPVREGIRDVV